MTLPLLPPQMRAEKAGLGCIQPPETSTNALRQRDLALKIPEHVEKHLPLAHIPIQALMTQLKNFAQKPLLFTEIGKCFFSSLKPNTDLVKLFDGRPVLLPPSDVLKQMENSFDELWRHGEANSIRDRTDQSVLFPPCALTMYRKLIDAVEIRRQWAVAELWMRPTKPSRELSVAIRETRALMHSFEWNERLNASLGGNVRTRDLMPFLSNNWLSDTHIDLMLEVLTVRLERETAYNDVIIAPTAFQQILRIAYNQRDEKKGHTYHMLEQYREELFRHEKRRLFFVGHVNGNHWVAWKVDFSSRTMGHGQLLSAIVTFVRRR